MAEWYIHADPLAGDDAMAGNGGRGTLAAPRLTPPTSAMLLSDGGTGRVNLLESSFRPPKAFSADGVLAYANVPGVVVRTAPGENNYATVRGDIVVSETFLAGLGDAWYADIGTLSRPSAAGPETAPGSGVYYTAVGATWNYDTSINASGHHFGFLLRVASQAACDATPWSVFYDSGAGRLWVNLDGADPNGGTVTVLNINGALLVSLDGCDDGAVEDMDFRASAVFELGYAVMLRALADGRAERLTFSDIGSHAVGIISCTGDTRAEHVDGQGMTPDGTAGVGYSSAIDVACSFYRWTVDAKPWLLADQSRSNNLAGQKLAFAHTNGTTAVTDVLVDRCLMRGVSAYLAKSGGDEFVLADCQNAAAPSAGNRLSPAAYPVRVRRSSVTGVGVHRLLGGANISFDRCRFELAVSSARTSGGVGTDGLLGYGSAGIGNPQSEFLLANSEVLANLDSSSAGDLSMVFGIKDTGANTHLSLLNVSVLESGVQAATNIRGMFAYHGENRAKFHTRGSAFGFATGRTLNAFCWDDIGVADGNLDHLDNVYNNITSTSDRMSHPANGGRAAQTGAGSWLAAIDTTAKFTTGALFASQPATLKPAAGGYLDLNRSVRVSPLPAAGYDGSAYSDFYGAWQIPASAPGAFALSSPADGAYLNDSAVSFAWGASAGVASYTLEVAADAGFASVVMAESMIEAEAMELRDGVLDADAVHYWRVTALNAAGSAAASASRSFDTGPPPVELSASGGFDIELSAALTLAEGVASTIKERIEQRIVALLGTLAGVGAVHRWDFRGNELSAAAASGEAVDVLVVPGDEQADPATLGNDGETGKRFTLTVAAVIRPAEDDTAKSGALLNEWIGRIERLVMHHATVYEPAGACDLAVDTHTVATEGPTPTDAAGSVAAAVVFEVEYRHFRLTPFAGPGIAARLIA